MTTDRDSSSENAGHDGGGSGAPSPAIRRSRRRPVVVVTTVLALTLAALGMGWYFLTPAPAGAEFGETSGDTGNKVQYRTPREVGTVFTDGAIQLQRLKG
jgi:hypothetical protein